MVDQRKPLLRTATPEDVAKKIKQLIVANSGQPYPCVTFLVGAGFSVSAGIPAAGALAKEVRRRHDYPVDKHPTPATESEYSYAMGLIPPFLRNETIREAVECARDGEPRVTRINWAHLLLATMVRAGYVNRILTTNFDPLILDALALIGQPVRAFDLTASEGYQANLLPASVVYLHGQACGPWLTNTRAEIEKVQKNLNSVLQDAVSQSMVIAVGYSGANDPVCEELSARFRCFQKGLFWVHYDPADAESKPVGIVEEMLCDHAREASLVTGLSADEFMRDLVLTNLKLDLPEIVRSPLQSLLSSLERIMPFPQPEGTAGSPNPVDVAKEQVRKAIEAQEAERIEPVADTAGQGDEKGAGKPGIQSVAVMESAIAMAGMTHNETVLDELLPSVIASGRSDLKTALADAMLACIGGMMPRKEHEKALVYLETIKDLGATEKEWVETIWGNVLTEHAQVKAGEEAERLFTKACARHERATQIKPDMHEAFNNWGSTLGTWAKAKEGAEADHLLEEACVKFERATQIKPDRHEAFNNWGNALADWAKGKEGAEADRLFSEACAIYERATQIKPDMHEAFSNWGNALADWAKGKEGAEANRLFSEACAKYERTTQIKPDKYEAFNNWGITLGNWAKPKEGAEADRLFEEACVKFERATQIKPNNHELFSNWGAALLSWASKKTGTEAEHLLSDAAEKLHQSLELDPEDSYVPYNLACVEGLRGNAAAALDWLEKWRALDPKASRKMLDGDTDLDRIRDDPAFIAFRASLPE